MAENLGSLFLEHASGKVSYRALRARQIRILQFMSEYRFTISRETFAELNCELDGIEQAIAEVAELEQTPGGA